MGRYQLTELRAALDALEEDLEARGHAGLPADDLLLRLARMSRGLHDVIDGHMRVAIVLCNCIDHAAHLRDGHRPLIAHDVKATPATHFNPAGAAAIGLASLVHGEANVALALFAELYPEYAVRLNREAVDRLVLAWRLPDDGAGKWPTLVHVCRASLGFKLDVTSLKREAQKQRALQHATYKRTGGAG